MADYTSASTAKIFTQVNAVKINEVGKTTGLGEVPVIEDSVTVNSGDVDKTEIKLINGTTWTSKTSKGDSDVSFQIPALDKDLLDYFFTADSATGTYKLDVCQKSADVTFVDSDGTDTIKFNGCELYASLVLGDGDNPGYINVTVTPKDTFTVSWVTA